MFLAKGPEPDAEPGTASPSPGAGGNRLWLWAKRHHHALVGVGLLLLAGFAIYHVWEEFKYDEVMAYLQGLPRSTVLEALLLTGLGYFALAGYDLSALIYLRIRVPHRLVAFAAMAGYAISNNVGFAVLSGGSVRYRVYSVAGLSAADIARVVVFSTTTFSLGLTAVGGMSLLIGPGTAAVLLSVPDWVIQAIAGVTLLGLTVLTVFMAVKHRPVKLGPWTITLPSSGLVVAQILIAAVELMLAAGALYVLLPVHDIGYPEFLGIYCGALIIAIFSHVPGGIGVFETIILLGLSERGSTSGVLGALLAYRAIYYVLPLVLAGVMLAIWEVRAHGMPRMKRRHLDR